jgi:hypothetical protein
MLVSLGWDAGNSSVPATLIERFATREECVRVQEVMLASRRSQALQCIQARVAKP